MSSKWTFLFSCLTICLVAVFISSCDSAGDRCIDGIQNPCLPTGEPYEKLSDYNLYSGNLKELNPVAGLLPYDLNTQLFSDYAQKQRFVYVPEDSAAEYNTDGVLDFPVGSMLVKNFYYDLDQRDVSSARVILETRLLIHRQTGWTAQTYVWNEEQTEANLELAGAQKDVTWINEKGISRKVNFLIPTKNDCKTCHSHNGNLLPLGPEVRNLNKTYPYADGEENQLAKWKQAGILKDVPDFQKVPKVPVWDDSSAVTLNERARIYLDVNCANCHNPAGSANHSQLFLSYNQKASLKLGIYKPPVAAGQGSGGLRYSIVPGHPDKSILVHRMESTHPAVRMPEIGRTLVHDEAVELIQEWIKRMGTNKSGNGD